MPGPHTSADEREQLSLIHLSVRCPRSDESDRHSSVVVNCPTVGHLISVMARQEGCEHCGAIFNSFVPIPTEPSEIS